MKSLLYEILADLEWERLLEEGVDPIKKLHDLFDDKATPEVVDKIIAIDPNKKKSYALWTLNKWDNESDVILEALNNGRLKMMFDLFKKKLSEGEKHAVQLKDFTSVAEVLRDYVPEADTVLTKFESPETYVMNLRKNVDSELANDFDVVYQDDKWLIAVPNTYEAACKLGENMRWCTANAYGKGEGYYEDYTRRGKLYVNFDLSEGESRNGKDYPYTRYQFHFVPPQFNDKDNYGVDINDIGMPEGAFDYYKSEGYDEDIFQNDEERWEAYENWRDQYDYYLTDPRTDYDGLYLCIAYDDDYDREDVDEYTSFYLYDEQDSRDPISWTEYKNPHIDDSFIQKDGGLYFSLIDRYGVTNVVVWNPNVGYGRGWENYSDVSHLTEIGTGEGAIAFIDENRNLKFYTTETSEEFRPIKGYDFESIHVRGSDEHGTYVEAIYNDERYHALFIVSDTSIDAIIRFDSPKNGKWFTVNGDGVIEGMFRNYDYFRSNKYADEEHHLSNCNIVQAIENANEMYYIIEDENTGDKNILRHGEKEPLLPHWFNEIDLLIDNIAVASSAGGNFFCFGLNGETINTCYRSVRSGTGFIVGYKYENKVDFIDTKTCEIYDSFESLGNGFGGRIQVGIKNTTEDVHGSVVQKIYDIKQRKVVHPEMSIIKPLKGYMFLCDSNNGDNGYLIYDMRSDIIIADNILLCEPFNEYHESGYIWYIERDNNKCNLLDCSLDGGLALPEDADRIVSKTEVSSNIVYMLNGKYFPYNYREKIQLITSQGSELEIRLDEYWFTCEYGKYRLLFSSRGEFVGYDDYGGTARRPINECPQEVQEAYNRIIGNGTGGTSASPQQQEVQVNTNAVREEFFRTLKRLDDAFRTIHNTL